MHSTYGGEQYVVLTAVGKRRNRTVGYLSPEDPLDSP